MVECETMSNLWDKDDEFAHRTYDPINCMDIHLINSKKNFLTSERNNLLFHCLKSSGVSTENFIPLLGILEVELLTNVQKITFDILVNIRVRTFEFDI